MHLHGHVFRVVEIDGKPLARPLDKDVSLVRANGGTLSWIFDANRLPGPLAAALPQRDPHDGRHDDRGETTFNLVILRIATVNEVEGPCLDTLGMTEGLLARHDHVEHVFAIKP